MAYEKHNFNDGEVLSAEHLNAIEDGIVQNESDIKSKADLDETGKIKAEQIPDSFLEEDELSQAINSALSQAKESGEFKGDKGDKGDKGEKGDTGSQGEKGADGQNGKDGTSVTVKSVSESTADGGSNVVTFSDGKTVTIKNGLKGSTGDKGDKGAKGDAGDKGADGYTPIKGTDYFTESDKAEMVAMVIESLGGNPVFGYVNKNNSIILSGNLADGNYSVKYDMEDGSTIDIGNLVIDTNVYHSVTNNLTKCSNSNKATEVIEGNSYTAVISANSGYELSSVVVRMGGVDITTSAVSGGNINIANVTGNIVITAEATEIVVTPTYTNLAKNFTIGRIRGTGEVDSTVTAATTCTDYIPFTPGTVVRVKGFGALTDYNCGAYKSDGTVYSSSKANAEPSVFEYSYDSTNGIVTLKALSGNVATMRVSGILTGTTADVIITVNEPIV